MRDEDIKTIIRQVCREIDIDQSRVDVDFDEDLDLWTFDVHLHQDKHIRVHLDSGDIEKCLKYDERHTAAPRDSNERCAG